VPPLTSYRTSCSSVTTNYKAIVGVSQTIQTASNTYASYLQNIPVYMQALQKTIAAALADSQVSLADVIITSISSTSSNSKQNAAAATADADSTPRSFGSRNNGLKVEYVIMSYINGITNSALAANLEKAIDAGNFDSLLQQFAVTEGASGFASASSSKVSVNAFLSEDAGDGGDEDNNDGENDGGDGDGDSNSSGSSGSSSGSIQGLSTTAQYAIGGAVVALFIIILAGFLYACQRRTIAISTASTASLNLQPLGGKGGKESDDAAVARAELLDDAFSPSAPSEHGEFTIAARPLPVASRPAEAVTAQNVHLSV